MSDERDMTGSGAKETQGAATNAMWGGRFADGPSAIMREINASIPFDKALWRQDIAASKAHVAMLGAAGIIAAEDAEVIAGGLNAVAAEYEADGVPEDWDREDIHMTTEARLAELIGPVAGRLHTARSRNDQVATDFRLWVRDAMAQMDEGLGALQRALVTRAGEHAGSIMPGFTHLQTAQPVTLGHHLMAYYEMFRRDRARLADARVRMNECPLGSAALAGTGFPIDRAATAAALGFDRPMANSIDAVSARDFALEFCASASIAATTAAASHVARRPPGPSGSSGRSDASTPSLSAVRKAATFTAMVSTRMLAAPEARPIIITKAGRWRPIRSAMAAGPRARLTGICAVSIRIPDTTVP